jgi:hypothetical protein
VFSPARFFPADSAVDAARGVPAARGDERLDAPRLRFPVLRRATLLRGVVVAALLCLAAGVLLIDRAPPATTPAAPRAAATSPAPVLPPGTVGLPLRLRDSGVVAVVRPGHRVDVLGATSDGRAAETLATRVLVLRITARGDAPEDGALLYLAVTAEQAARLAGYTTEARITVTVRSP